MGLNLSLKEARQIALASQGLNETSPFDSVEAALKRLSYVQIDTISVVERAHHHVLWSRLPNYEPQLLDLAQKNSTVFEYWSHAAAYLPMEHYPFCIPRMRVYAEGKAHWFSYDRKLSKRILDRIRAEGPLMARDFESAKSSSGPWWDWKPSKIALEHLFHSGILMVRERKNFQKVYDLAERVLPSTVKTTEPTPEEFCRHLIQCSLKSQGISTELQMRYQRRTYGKDLAPALRKQLRSMEQEGEIVDVRVEKREERYFALAEEIEKLSSQRAPHDLLYILSPFDNVVIQRKRLQSLFDFNYQIECYTPAPKRKFGYFCLPMLYRNKFVGQIDLKADRQNQRLQINALHWKNGLKKTAKLQKALEGALVRFARFNFSREIR